MRGNRTCEYERGATLAIAEIREKTEIDSRPQPVEFFGFRRQAAFVTLQLTTKDFLDHIAMDIGQSPVDSVVTESELLVINAELMQNRRV